ncbi:MAG: hypothetical protein ACM3XS_02100 [Bacteroidota bacterium]
MDQTGMPGQADNAENAVKCAVCGNTILVGSEDGRGQRSAVCDVCRSREPLTPERIAGASNEDY